MKTKAKQLLQTEFTLDHESMLQRIKDLSEIVKMQNDWMERAKPYILRYLPWCKIALSEQENFNSDNIKEILKLISEVQDVD